MCALRSLAVAVLRVEVNVCFKSKHTIGQNRGLCFCWGSELHNLEFCHAVKGVTCDTVHKVPKIYE